MTQGRGRGDGGTQISPKWRLGGAAFSPTYRIMTGWKPVLLVLRFLNRDLSPETYDFSGQLLMVLRPSRKA